MATDQPSTRTVAAPPRTLAWAVLICALPSLAGCGSAPEERSLLAPPELQVGEWWAVEVEPDLVGTTFRTTLVVTERSDGRATLGIPPDDFYHHFLVLHIPPLGDLDLQTFAWRVMWDDFAALRFPLEPGRTWESDFHGNDVVAEVAGVEGARAQVTMVGEGERIQLTYDAEMGMITEFREEALRLGFRVIDHGFGYTGPVRSLSGIQLGLMEAGAGGRSSSTAEVESGASHGSLSLVLWNTGGEGEAGRYRIVATAPDGTTFEETFEPGPDSPPVMVASFGHDVVDGTWHIEFEEEGPGRLLVELFTYDMEEMELGAEGGRPPRY